MLTGDVASHLSSKGASVHAQAVSGRTHEKLVTEDTSAEGTGRGTYFSPQPSVQLGIF